MLWPLELIFQRASRPVERAVWLRALSDRAPDSEQRWSERVVRYWAEQRLRRSVARDLENDTLIGAVRQLVRAGLPITAVLIAVNPVWGFSWYFNSENWASAAWQKIAESRVDEWREAMIDAAVRVQGRRRRDGARASSRSRRPASTTATFRSSSSAIPAKAIRRSMRFATRCCARQGVTR